MTDEDFVNRQWARAELCENRGRHAFCVSLGGRGFTRACIPEREVESADRAWAAAAEFTRERLEQIRQVEVEVQEICTEITECFDELLSGIVHGRKEQAETESICLCRWYRILEREQVALAELKKGMRP